MTFIPSKDTYNLDLSRLVTRREYNTQENQPIDIRTDINNNLNVNTCNYIKLNYNSNYKLPRNYKNIGITKKDFNLYSELPKLKTFSAHDYINDTNYYFKACEVMLRNASDKNFHTHNYKDYLYLQQYDNSLNNQTIYFNYDIYEKWWSQSKLNDRYKIGYSSYFNWYDKFNKIKLVTHRDIESLKIYTYNITVLDTTFKEAIRDNFHLSDYNINDIVISSPILICRKCKIINTTIDPPLEYNDPQNNKKVIKTLSNFYFKILDSKFTYLDVKTYLSGAAVETNLTNILNEGDIIQILYETKENEPTFYDLFNQGKNNGFATISMSVQFLDL